MKPLDRSCLGALRAIVPTPTAPYRESRAQQTIRAYAAARGWRVSEDAVGNLTLRVPGVRVGRPRIAFSAHLDHPGFVVEGSARSPRVLFFGGYPDTRMVGGKVRLFGPQGEELRTSVVNAGKRRASDGATPVELKGDLKGVGPDWFGMWDLVPLRVSKKTVTARVCDDLAGAASILAALDFASKWDRSGARPTKKLPHAVLAIFTRCEENGFVGCLEGLHRGSFDPRIPVVVLECSPKLPNAKPGDGPILRVGDRLSIYDADLLERMGGVGEQLAKRHADFRWQRKLMDGGACEATAFCAAGFRAAGLCMALTNYHNIHSDDPGRSPAPEQVDRNDFYNLARWIGAIAKASAEKGWGGTSTSARLEKLRSRRASRLLPRT